MSLVANTGQTYCGRVSELRTDGQSTECILEDGRSMLVSRLLGSVIFRGDGIEFSLPSEDSNIGTEILVRKSPNSKRKDIYQAPISYVTRPKEDRRGQFYCLAEVRGSTIGVLAIRLNCDVIRDYFYVTRTVRRGYCEQPNFYKVLKASQSATPAELRLAYKLRELELRAAHADPRELKVIERAFNILAEPELRAYYDTLLKDPGAPLLFPYGGFGSVLVEGERSRDGKTYFARRILAFLPDIGECCFDAPLSKFHFYSDRAIYRDARRRLEVVVDQAAMLLVWDPTWNQWKHLLDAKVGVRAKFLQTGVYRMKDGEWNLLAWEKSLPSRVRVSLPAGMNERIQEARRRHHIFGQHTDFFTCLRGRIEREPVAKSEIERLFGEAGIPGDFGAEQVAWQAGYDHFYYRELLNRARQVYLFRDEFIMELEQAIVVEKPAAGHATYLFTKPVSLGQFLEIYSAVTRAEIRQNRHNIAERLGFFARIEHGKLSHVWLKELNLRLGDPAYSSDRRLHQ